MHPLAAHGLQGLHAAQGLHALAAQGLHGLHAAQGLHALAAQGLHALAAHGLQAFAAQGLHGSTAAAATTFSAATAFSASATTSSLTLLSQPASARPVAARPPVMIATYSGLRRFSFLGSWLKIILRIVLRICDHTPTCPRVYTIIQGSNQLKSPDRRLAAEYDRGGAVAGSSQNFQLLAHHSTRWEASAASVMTLNSVPGNCRV